MSRLIEDLLDVSRVMRGAIQLRKEPSDLSKVVDHAIEVTRSFIETRRHQLTVNLPEEPITLNVDPLRIEQVVTNLLHNAAKYTPEGGQINLSVGARAARPLSASATTASASPRNISTRSSTCSCRLITRWSAASVDWESV